MFRAATGIDSHQYVLERRNACAKQLLKERKTDLVEVAFCQWFFQSNHMTDAFRNHLGITPGEYRRSS
jgi:AraC family transcriptional regulator